MIESFSLKKKWLANLDIRPGKAVRNISYLFWFICITAEKGKTSGFIWSLDGDEGVVAAIETLSSFVAYETSQFVHLLFNLYCVDAVARAVNVVHCKLNI